jgi:hypothetical protein
MGKRAKLPLQSPGRSGGFLDLWSPPSDRSLHAVLHSDVWVLGCGADTSVEFRPKGHRSLGSRLDDFLALGVVAVLAACGVVIGWTLFVP